MAIAKMLLANIEGKLENLDEVALRLSDYNYFHPEHPLDILPKLNGYTAIAGENPYPAYLEKLRDLANSTGHSEMCRDADDALDNIDNPVEYVKDYINVFDQETKDLKAKLDTLKDEQKKNTEYIEQLAHFKGLSIKLSEVFACEYTKVRFGSIPKDSYPKLALYDANPYVMFFSVTTDDNGRQWGVYFTPKEHEDEVDRIFSHLYFERVKIPNFDGTPTEAILKLEAENNRDKEEIEKLGEQLSEYWNREETNFKKLFSFAKHMDIVSKLKAFAEMKNDSFILTGWVPVKHQDSFKKCFEGIADIDVSLDAPDSRTVEMAPVQLRNNRFSKPYETFTNMYGTPGYKDIDPTFFMSLTYTLIFGVMFGDLGQGFLIALGGFLAYKFKKMSLGPILLRCGISSMVFGFIYGSVFGYENWLSFIYEPLIGREKPFSTMAPEVIPMILIATIVAGVILIGVVMGMNVVISLKNKDYENALFGPNSISGIVFYFSLILGAVATLLGKHVMTKPYILLLIVLPVVLIFLREPLGKIVKGEKHPWPKKWGDFISQNIFEVFEYLLSYFTNTLSFLRIGAFVLSHAGMMMAVFALADMLGKSSIILYLIMVVFGNVFVIALEGLLVGIQCLRLHYYELFGRFYSGNGKKFMPINQR